MPTHEESKDWPDDWRQWPTGVAYFERVQINTTDAGVDAQRIGRWAWQRDARAILQVRGEFPAEKNVDMLFDLSGGRGRLPTRWPAAPMGTMVGYAGGLNADNVAEAVSKIGPVAGDYWIDMETGVRDADDRFDLDKCLAVCVAVYGAKS